MKYADAWDELKEYLEREKKYAQVALFDLERDDPDRIFMRGKQFQLRMLEVMIEDLETEFE